MASEQAKAVCENPQITVNAHSSIRLQNAQGLVAYVDPYLIDEPRHDADVICVTHSHYDHLCPESIGNICKESTLFAGPADVASELVKQGIAQNRITVVAPGCQCEIAGVPVQVVASYNQNKTFHPQENGWVGYVLTLDGARVYVAGDTDNTPEARAVACDIACVPVGGTYTMTADEAAQLVAALSPRPRLAIPEHYATLKGTAQAGERFQEELERLVGGTVSVALPF